MFKDLVESKAIYFFVVGLALVALSVWLNIELYTECRAHGFSAFYCIFK